MAKVAVGKIERQYHQAVEQRIRRGVLRPSSRVYLDTLRVQLGLSSERAIAIEAEALMPTEKNSSGCRSMKRRCGERLSMPCPWIKR
ncbi:MAG: hypothetical protein HC873_00610 [Leptolyngbyaceae cyanobacterium SL_1_1]|nr:hypothetical protein [Leptolyngbyaceae cyanobacterium SL_1_1]